MKSSQRAARPGGSATITCPSLHIDKRLSYLITLRSSTLELFWAKIHPKNQAFFKNRSDSVTLPVQKLLKLEVSQIQILSNSDLQQLSNGQSYRVTLIFEIIPIFLLIFTQKLFPKVIIAYLQSSRLIGVTLSEQPLATSLAEQRQEIIFKPFDG